MVSVQQNVYFGSVFEKLQKLKQGLKIAQTMSARKVVNIIVSLKKVYIKGFNMQLMITMMPKEK